LDAHGWELYHVDKDFAENHNLADAHRDRLIEMISLWYSEAGKYNVMPLDASATARLITERPLLTKDRENYTYYPGTSPVPGRTAVSVLNRPHSITAKVEIPEGGAEGVLLSQGDNMGGYTFFMQDNRLHYGYNYAGAREFHIASSVEIPAGSHELRFEFEPTGTADVLNGKGAPGRGQLYLDGKLVGQGDIEDTLPLQISLAALVACGMTPGAPIVSHYQPPYHFTGTIHTVTVGVSGDLIQDTEAEMRMVMARQ